MDLNEEPLDLYKSIYICKIDVNVQQLHLLKYISHTCSLTGHFYKHMNELFFLITPFSPKLNEKIREKGKEKEERQYNIIND